MRTVMSMKPSSQGTPKDDQTPKSSPRPGAIKRIVIAVLLGMVFVSLLAPTPPAVLTGSPVKLSQVLATIEDGKADHFWVDDNTNTVTVKLKDGKRLTATYPILWGRDLTTKLSDSGLTFEAVPVKKSNMFLSFIMNLLPMFLILGFLFYMMRKGSSGMMGMGRFGKKADPVEVPTVRFTDIAGIDEAVDELREVVDYLHDPSMFESTGATPSRGFLLVGPPGTGKTLLARAVAGEAGVPFFAVSGSDFVEIFAGMGASRVRDLFGKARAAGRAILFIDEIDAIGKSRGGQGFMSGSNDEREQTLNQILVELDGFSSSNVIILAATNRPDVLDPALVRPGRFDRKITVPAPDRKGRETIMRLHAKGRPFDVDINWEELAKRTPGLTGADIALLINEAALEAARRKAPRIQKLDLDNALATTVLGRARTSAVISERDRRIVAWHEAGHAVCALTQPDADDPVVISIVPRGGTGGVTWMSGNDNDFMTRNQALARLTTAMGGRAAEERLLGGDFTQGAHGDIESATALAREMIGRYGMGRNIVAVGEHLTVGDDPITSEAAELLATALENARALLEERDVLLRSLADKLLEDENVDLPQLLALSEKVDPAALDARDGHQVTRTRRAKKNSPVKQAPTKRAPGKKAPAKKASAKKAPAKKAAAGSTTAKRATAKRSTR